MWLKAKKEKQLADVLETSKHKTINFSESPKLKEEMG